MDENETSQSQSVEEVVDNLSCGEIDIIIDSINYNSLSEFDKNNELNNAIERDAFIINNVASQKGITRACEHGMKLSSVVKTKATRLNESTLTEVLDLIIRILKEKLGNDKDLEPGIRSHENCTDDKHAGHIDFKSISKYFSSKVLSYSSLSWDTLPLSDLISNPTASQQRKRRIQTCSSASSVPHRELNTMQKYEEQLETQKNLVGMYHSLSKASMNGPVDLWEFLLDRDPAYGFTKTCSNLYSLTFLAARGEVEFLMGNDKRIKLRACQNREGKTENSQGIISGWSYEMWLNLVNNSSENE